MRFELGVHGVEAAYDVGKKERCATRNHRASNGGQFLVTALDSLLRPPRMRPRRSAGSTPALMHGSATGGVRRIAALRGTPTVLLNSHQESFSSGLPTTTHVYRRSLKGASRLSGRNRHPSYSLTRAARSSTSMVPSCGNI